MRQSSLFILTAAALTAAMGTAQNETGNAAGYGGSALVIDLDAATGGVGQLGCVYAGGLIHVSARGNGATTAPPHTVYTFDNAGNAVGQYTQSTTGGSAWGWRDGATDEGAGGTANMWGYETGMDIVDQTGNPVLNYQSAAGSQAIPSQPVSGAVVVAAGTVRALAYDPAGNGNLGSFWTANFGSDIFEFDINGNILGTPLSGGWVAYGLALDAATGNLYVSAGPTADYLIAEVDPATGIPTGNEFPLPDQTAIYGGLSVMNTAPNVPFYNASVGFTGLVSVGQSGPDIATVHRLHDVLPGVLGYNEVFLSGGVNNGGQSRDPGTFFPGDRLNLRVEANGTAPGLPAWHVINYQSQAGLPGVLSKVGTNVNLAAPALGIGIAHEFVRQNFITSPADPNVTIIAGAVDATTNINIPAGSPTFPVGTGDILAVQSLHLSLTPVGGVSPFKATNEIFFDAEVPATGISVVAAGGNSFNSDITSGFFTVQHAGGSYAGLTIDTIEFDMANSANASWAGNGVFDTDQGGMADQFNGGDNTTAGCMGTYRNTTSTLVDFPAGGTVSTCATFTGTGTGFTGSGTSTTVNSYPIVTIACAAGTFGVGQNFEVDIDTDGGAGIAGDAMDGIICNITLSDSSVLTGPLAADPIRASTSLINWP